MDLLRPKPSSTQQPTSSQRPAKRISTPAGRRLSVILDNKRSKSTSPSPAAKISVTTTSTYCNDPTHQHIEPEQHGHRNARRSSKRLGDTPRESSEDQTPNGSSLSVSVWSDKAAEKFGQIRRRRYGGIASWGWKRIAIIAAILVALIVALAVGLALGLKKKSSRSNSPTTTTGGSRPAGSGTATSTSTQTDAPSPNATSTLTPSAVPSNFPVGSYSFVTFLDTVTTNCTADTNTWTCTPFTNYYIDPQKALTILNWEISGSSGSYKISSKGQDSTFDTTFQNENLELVDAGQDSERYWFQISRSKTVNMTGTVEKEKGTFECDYSVTNLQGFLYTKMQRTYPDDTITVPTTSNPVWPYAVRVEQDAAGGQNVPLCKDSSGDQVTMQAQDATTLCSCLYKNWTPAQ